MNTSHWHDQAKQKWDTFADHWNSRSVDMWTNGSRKDIIPFVKTHMEAGIHLADLGCGDGFGSFLLHKDGFRVTGVDISEQMIQHASKHASDGLEFIQGDLAHLPFNNETLDGAIAINSFEWTEDPLHSLNEVYRILRPKGRFCIGILGPTAGPRENSFSRLIGEPAICNTMMPWEFRELARTHHWTVVDEFYVLKNGIVSSQVNQFSNDLKQAVSFMTLFLLEKGE